MQAHRTMVPCSTLLLLLSAFVNVRAGALAHLTAQLPEVAAPPQGEVQWVAHSMRMNGLPMTLKVFRSPLPPDEILSYYESQSQRWGHNELRRSIVRGSRILAIRSSRYLITIEASESVAGSEGTITVSGAPENFVASTTTQFPHPQSARVLNRQEYDDAGVEAEHLSLASTRSAPLEAEAFIDELTRAGWQILRRAPMQTSSRGARGIVVEAQHGAELAQLTLQPDQSRLATTAIIVVWRKS